MQITVLSFISALLWSSLLIIVIYLVRRTRFRPYFGVLTMVLLYLFCATRLLLPLEFPHTVIVSDSVVYPRIYSFLTRKPEPVTHLVTRCSIAKPSALRGKPGHGTAARLPC